jgi:hypothetical protein
VDAAADDDAARGQGAQREGHETADRREDDRCVELLRRPRLGGAGPLGAELAGEALRALVALACEGEDAPALPGGDLREDVGCGRYPISPAQSSGAASSGVKAAGRAKQ